MRMGSLLVAALAVTTALPAWAAGDIKAAVNFSTDKANDLRGLTFAAGGKLITSGHVGAEAAQERLVVARFNANGTPDTAFSGDGFVEVDVAPGRGEQSLGVVELTGGDVMVAVNAVDADGGTSVYLLRFDAAGNKKVAPAWGDAEGKVEVVFGWANANNGAFTGATKPVDTSWDLQIDRSGGTERVVVFGMGAAVQGSNRTDIDRYVVRLNAANGTVDPTFNGGKAFTYHSAGTLGDNARRGLVEADGKIVHAGYTNLGTGLGNHIILFRLTAAGVLDTTFGGFIEPGDSGRGIGLNPTPGVAVLNPLKVDGGVAECYGVARLSDGTYVTTGYGATTAAGEPSTLGFKTSAGPDLVTFHVTATGLDRSWGGKDGKGAQAVQSEGLNKATVEDRGRHLVALPDNRTVQVGRFGGAAAAFVFTPAGVLDATVDGDGIVEVADANIDAQFFNAVVSPDGKRIAATTNAHAKGARLVVFEVQ